MISKVIKKQGRNITLVGSFNPKIFHPEWFFLNKIISEKEKDSAEIKFITNDVAVFKTELLSLEVTRERFSAFAVSDIAYERLREVVIGTFELLSHTPVTMMGFNYDYDFEVSDKEYWHKTGYFLSGKKYLWGKVLPNPGLVSLNVESPIDESNAAIMRKILITTGPSKKDICENGLHVHVNDHFEVKEKEKITSATMVETIIKERWDASQKYTEATIMKVLDLIMEGIENDTKKT